MTSLPNDEPPSAFILLDEDGVVGNIVDVEVLREKYWESLRVPESRVEQLSDEEATRRVRSLVGGLPVQRLCCQKEKLSECFLIASMHNLTLLTMMSS